MRVITLVLNQFKILNFINSYYLIYYFLIGVKTYILFLSTILDLSHFDISGEDCKDKHSVKI